MVKEMRIAITIWHNRFLIVENGTIPESVVDGKVRNILRLMFRTTMNRNRPYGSFKTPAHASAARKIAEEGIVLLQNKTMYYPFVCPKPNAFWLSERMR